MKTLVFIEQRDGKLKSTAFEALTVGAQLAGNIGDIAAVLVGKGIQSLASQLAGYGCDKVFVVEGDNFEKYNSLAYRSAVEAAAKKWDAKVVVGVATPMGRDIFPRLAARLDGGLMTDVIELSATPAGLTATKPMYAGKCLATLTAEGDGAKLATIRPNVFKAVKSGTGSAAVEALNVQVADASALTTVEVRKGKSEKPDLTEAKRIISGGRAMASADNFKILHSCAEVLHATVGASRAAVDSGYAPHDMQVGQTGKVVNPDIYIACGISGSIQHMAGMRTAKTIIAINTDPEAPIFSIADYGIVGDLFEAVPLLTEELKKVIHD
jgi:electron transfer flavoprotein alpha subunit